jgi:membrane associated rhomboid family serine protease
MLPIDFRRTPITLSFAMVIAALEIVCTLDYDRRFYYYNDLKLGILSTIWMGELWRPFTTTLLHGHWIHAAFNLYWLLVFGQVLKERLGSLRYLAVCVLLAYVSMMPEFIVLNYRADLHGQQMIVGFSGVIYGLFGLLWIGRRWRPEFSAVCNDDIVRLMLGWLVLCVGLTLTGIMPVANIAHGSGLLFGALYAMAAFAPQHRRRWAMLAGLATLVVLATLIGFPGHRGYEAVRQRRQLEQYLKILRLQSPPEHRPAGDR